MALTEFQRDLCRLIARNRAEQGEAYVAGGAALGAALRMRRVSRDIDLFHDTREALAATYPADLRLLEAHAYEVEVLYERPAYAEAVVRKGVQSVVVQWTCDSAYRFFPLVEEPDLGLTLHPFDLATNKVLALAGRAEVRDWVDAMECHRLLQPFGYLAWAACGKDPSLNPAFIIEESRRTAPHTQAELDDLVFDGATPRAEDLCRQWKDTLKEAEAICGALPPERVGCCVLDANLELYTGTAPDLPCALAENKLLFHKGAIKGAWPRIIA